MSRTPSFAWLGLYAAAVVAVPTAVVLGPGALCGQGHHSSVPEQDADEGADQGADPDAVAALTGIWRLQAPGGEQDDLHFYYFHGDGKGLYRYGKVGLNNTHSFDYDVVGGALELTFRKTGERHRIGYELRPDLSVDGRSWLTLDPDPRGTGGKYFRDPDEPGPREVATTGLATGLAAGLATGLAGDTPAGHMWIDMQHYATGGVSFGFYQLRDAGIDGRGVGWFHRGDFDEWSTEALIYRVSGASMELTFPVRGEQASTPFAVLPTGDGGRQLVMEQDPRDFWHGHVYLDAGPSFGARATPFDAVTGVRPQESSSFSVSAAALAKPRQRSPIRATM